MLAICGIIVGCAWMMLGTAAVAASWTGKWIVWYIVWPLPDDIGTCFGDDGDEMLW